MATVVRMPSVVAGATSATLASWLVKPGDAVSVGTPLAEIETEKALVEYAAEEAGTVARLVLAAGGAGDIGDPIAVLLGAGETDSDVDAALGAAAAGTGTTVNGGTAAAPRPAPDGERIFASPLVRKRAAEQGIALAQLARTGTGPNGRIVRRDLERFLEDSRDTPVPRAPAEPSPSRTLIPHTPMRRAIARRLTESKATVPHFYLTAEPVLTRLLDLRQQVNQSSAARVSINDFVIAAVAAAFTDVPEANVTWTDEGLVTYRSVDLSIAVATDAGLVTPVLRGVEGKRLSAIARETAALAARARDRTLRQHELEGGTFAISNLGMYGTPEFSAILNPPQSGILAVGAARPQPVVVDGALAVATVMRCTLSVDHRAIDGALAARWLAAFTTRMEDPLSTVI